mmetsp:Transcript_25734/g.74443  ORF Transcript_25734/g.74443 Transcript_25734/m.74443 type:complete len:249 (+) Transcript_25734:1136-1882(+)
MRLGLFHVNGLSDVASLVNVTAVIQQDRRRHYGPGRTFEVDGIDLIVANQGDEQPRIGLRHVATTNVSLVAQDGLNFIENRLECIEGFIVILLRRRETDAINTIRKRVDQVSRFVNLVPLGDRVQIQRGIFGKFVEATIQHLHNLQRFPGNNRTSLLIPKHGDSIFPIGFTGLLVQVPNAFAPKDGIGFIPMKYRGKGSTHTIRIGYRCFALRVGEHPSRVWIRWVIWSRPLPYWVHNCHGYDVLQSF